MHDNKNPWWSRVLDAATDVVTGTTGAVLATVITSWLGK
jgi:hypothetical protein